MQATEPRVRGDATGVWSAVVSGYDVRLGLRCAVPGLRRRVRNHLPPGLTPESPPRGADPTEWFEIEAAEDSRPGAVILRRAGQEVVETADRSELLRRLEGEMQIALGERAPDHLFVHAGVVAWGERAVLVPGRSRSGKSELVLEMIRAGAEYGSDEYAVLDRAGRVHAFPRRLSLRRPGGRRERLAPQELGGHPFRGPRAVGMVAVTEFRDGAAWDPRPITEAEGLMALLANTVCVRQRPEFALAVLRRAVEGATCLRSARGEATRAARRILDSCESLAA